MCLTQVKDFQRKAEKYLVPIIEERYQLPPEERPNDMLSWLMEDAIGEEKDPRNLTLRVLVVNFAAIHTTSMVSRFLSTYIRLAIDVFCEDLLVCHVPTARSVSHGLKISHCSHDVPQSRMHTASSGRNRDDCQGTRLDQGLHTQYAQTR